MFRISLSNASLLSVLYMVAGVIIEACRRWFHFTWAERASLSMEIFPARTLQLFGAFEPLQQAFFEQRVSDLQVRLIYAGVSVTVIFVSGLMVGTLMWGVSKALTRQS